MPQTEELSEEDRNKYDCGLWAPTTDRRWWESWEDQDDFLKEEASEKIRRILVSEHFGAKV